MITLENAISQLHYQGQAIAFLVEGLDQDRARWKPDSESWSILEVLNHLVDEEVLDFRLHLAHILQTPDQPWPVIDPQAWVTEKAYNQRDLKETLGEFKSERQKSIAWLMTLDQPDWDAVAEMRWGKLTAGDMLASWLAHDLLHLRQCIELRYQLTSKAVQPYRVEYAGEW